MGSKCFILTMQHVTAVTIYMDTCYFNSFLEIDVSVVLMIPKYLRSSELSL